ncbi:hypothetical protein [Lentilactobacillus sp. SPB1-3]|uniref:Uncharacterized protein n=1 Tax=Lentilactobacillus terminaliae TaxID=3003483 RepID=A0ACD5DDC9_9LACO|nr:hypothetical protein [Lentilactobacillus sp. SPB1-3]MCZ0977296.1 hypothetical protein [Lentilactobacillus sp. SPB1-3]
MEMFRVRFINQITDETIRIGYTAILENNLSPVIYEGRQVFYRDHLQPNLLKTGEAALEALDNIFQAIPEKYVLKQVAFEASHNAGILQAPKKRLFNDYIMEHGLLERVKYHRDDEDNIIIDTNLITELRIG